MKTSVFSVLIFLAFVCSTHQACLSPWVELNGECLLFLTENFNKGSWDAARQHCQSLGADLAVVKTASLHREIYNYIKNYEITGSFWLGGTDQLLEDTWVWVDGTIMERGTPYWALAEKEGLEQQMNQEPLGGANENCLLLSEERLYYFDDVNCALTGYHPTCMTTTVA